MIAPDAALGIILEHVRPLKPVRVALEEALGCFLAEDVRADRDLPPAERRRASRLVKAALGVGLDAVTCAGADAATLATVFTSSSSSVPSWRRGTLSMRFPFLLTMSASIGTTVAALL